MQALLDKCDTSGCQIRDQPELQGAGALKREVTLKCLHHINAVHELDPW